MKREKMLNEIEKELVRKVFERSYTFEDKCNLEKIGDKEVRRVVIDVLCGISFKEDYKINSRWPPIKGA